MFSVYHDQKDGSEFSDVTLASEDDNDNSDLNECDQEVEKTPIEDYGQDVIFNRSLVNFLITFNLIRVIIIIIGSRSNIGELTAIFLDTLHCKASCRSSPILNFSNFLSTITSELSLSSSDTRVTSEVL